MKKLLFLCLIVPCFAFGQTDSSKITQTITLTQLHHTYLVGFMSNFSTSDRINYVNQVRAQYDTANMAQTITVTASSDLILQVYTSMTSKPEGLTSEYNNEIRDTLLPQLTNAWLLGKLAQIAARNNSERAVRIAEAKQFIMEINSD